MIQLPAGIPIKNGGVLARVRIAGLMRAHIKMFAVVDIGDPEANARKSTYLGKAHIDFNGAVAQVYVFCNDGPGLDYYTFPALVIFRGVFGLRRIPVFGRKWQLHVLSAYRYR